VLCNLETAPWCTSASSSSLGMGVVRLRGAAAGIPDDRRPTARTFAPRSCAFRMVRQGKCRRLDERPIPGLDRSEQFEHACLGEIPTASAGEGWALPRFLGRMDAAETTASTVALLRRRAEQIKAKGKDSSF